MSESIDCNVIQYQMGLIEKELNDVAPLFMVIKQRKPIQLKYGQRVLFSRLFIMVPKQ